MNHYMLADLLKTIENQKAGLRSPFADHQKRPLRELLADYRRHQQDNGNTPKQAEQAARRCEKVFSGCKAAAMSDLDATTVGRCLGERRGEPKAKGGISPQTHNHYVTALKAFGNWLVSARKVPENPFRFLGKVNVEVDVRQVRRPLTAEEFARLLAAAAVGNPFRGVSGPDRVMAYTVASFTGLRARELTSLTPTSFSLDATPPTLTVAAAYSKHRREDVLPLHPDLVAHLRPWLGTFPADAPLWPGKWASQYAAAVMLKKDLAAAAARQAWLAEVTGEERTIRERSDFLAYADRSGQTADFHSLRHRFVTELVAAGVQPKDAKELARHSTITLTMDRYAHGGLQDTAAAVAKLPGVAKPSAKPGAATGAAMGDGGGGRVRANATRIGPPGVGRVKRSTPLSFQGLRGVAGGFRRLTQRRGRDSKLPL